MVLSYNADMRTLGPDVAWLLRMSGDFRVDIKLMARSSIWRVWWRKRIRQDEVWFSVYVLKFLKPLINKDLHSLNDYCSNILRIILQTMQWIHWTWFLFTIADAHKAYTNQRTIGNVAHFNYAHMLPQWPVFNNWVDPGGQRLHLFCPKMNAL